MNMSLASTIDTDSYSAARRGRCAKKRPHSSQLRPVKPIAERRRSPRNRDCERHFWNLRYGARFFLPLDGHLGGASASPLFPFQHDALSPLGVVSAAGYLPGQRGGSSAQPPSPTEGPQSIGVRADSHKARGRLRGWRLVPAAPHLHPDGEGR